MLRRPRLLILDEPANGMDPAGIRDLRAALRRLAHDGVTVVLSSHDMAQVEEICDSVTVLNSGRAVFAGRPGHDAGRRARPGVAPAHQRRRRGRRGRPAASPASRPPPTTTAAWSCTPPRTASTATSCTSAGEGVAVRGLELDVTPLESLFFQLTGEPQQQGPPAPRRPHDPRRRPVAGVRRARGQRTRPGRLVVWRLELAKLCGLIRVRVIAVLCILGPFLAVAALHLQSATPGDTAFGQWVHTSGFAIPMVVLGFAAPWIAPGPVPRSWPGTSSPPRTTSAPGRPS